MKEKYREKEYKNKQFNDIKLTGREVVVQSNILIDSFKKTRLMELKFFCFLISKVNPQNPDNMCFRVTVKDLAKALGAERSIENIYRVAGTIVKNLMEKVITIYANENGKRTITNIPLLSYAKYWIDEGYADVEISPYLAPYVVNLHKEFTQYRLVDVMSLDSTYAMRIYEMLKKQETIGCRTFYLDDLREKLGTSNKYKAYKDFRINVLDLAQREINQKTDLLISYTPKKSKNKIVAIEFDIKKKELNKKVEILSNDIDSIPDISTSTVQKIFSFGFSLKDTMNMVKYISDYEAKEAIIAAEEQINKGNIRNKKALIRTALKEKWKKNAIAEEKAEIDTDIDIELNRIETDQTRTFGISSLGYLMSDFVNRLKKK